MKNKTKLECSLLLMFGALRIRVTSTDKKSMDALESSTESRYPDETGQYQDAHDNLAQNVHFASGLSQCAL